VKLRLSWKYDASVRTYGGWHVLGLFGSALLYALLRQK